MKTGNSDREDLPEAEVIRLDDFRGNSRKPCKDEFVLNLDDISPFLKAGDFKPRRLVRCFPCRFMSTGGRNGGT